MREASVSVRLHSSCTIGGRFAAVASAFRKRHRGLGAHPAFGFAAGFETDELQLHERKERLPRRPILELYVLYMYLVYIFVKHFREERGDVEGLGAWTAHPDLTHSF